jgi:CubicO group peptidase (beta-lactamase class C family)
MAAPVSQHVNEAALANAYSRGQSTVGLHSLLVVRNGFLIREQYFGDATADRLQDVRSVTKSVMSLLVGIAIAQGVLPGTSERLDALIHPPVAVIDGPKAGITVDNLLTMTSGFSWDESTPGGYNEWVLAPDQIDFLLARPLSDLPGARFNYNSAAVHLLSVGLSQAAARSTQSFADENLFAPLGISDRAWEVDNRGYNNGAAGLSLRPRDLAKIGQLVLQDGKSAARSVVPAAWINEMVATHQQPGWQYGPVTRMAYGYLWWLSNVGGHAVAFGWGYRGQYVLVARDLNLVVVATSALDAPIPPDQEAEDVLDLIVSGVLPAIGG